MKKILFAWLISSLFNIKSMNYIPDSIKKMFDSTSEDYQGISYIPDAIKKMCDSQLEDYHCRKLRSIFFCIHKFKQTEIEPEITLYCNDQERDVKWHITYHIKNLGDYKHKTPEQITSDIKESIDKI